MAVLTIRNVDDSVKQRLREHAAINGRSVEAEVRAILESAVREDPNPASLVEDSLDAFAGGGGVESELPPRDAARELDLEA